MLMTKITDAINLLFGTVEFDIIGAVPERFLTAVMRENTDVWAIRKTDGCTLRMKSRMINAEKLSALAAETACEMRILAKRGVPVFLQKYRFRYGLAVGLALFLATLLFLSSFVWSVEVIGVDTVYEKEKVLAVLREHGFYVGAFLGDQDYTALKYAAMRELDEYGYLTVNVYGTRATVEVTRKVETPRILSRFDPCNIVASHDGVIVSVRAYNGLSAVKKGDAVRAGQLLVGGIYDSKVLGYRVVHAAAVIMARTVEEMSEYVAFDEAMRTYTGNEAAYHYVEILGFRIPLSFRTESPYEDFTVHEKRTEAALFDKYRLPLFFGTVTYAETKPLSSLASREAALEEARARLFERARVAFAGLLTEATEETVTETENGVTVTHRYTVIRDIAKEQEIYTEEIVWRTFLP